jgi:hypothetical protein
MEMLIKDINIKTLESGDKSGKIVLMTTEPEQIDTLQELLQEVTILVTFKKA